MAERVYIAIDLGAESGRVIAGIWDGKTLRLDELHRFPNGPVLWADTLRWDVLRLWAEIQTGLALAAKKYGKRVVSVGADTWGVDFVLLDKHGELLGLPYHYRDARTRGMLDKAFRKVSRARIFGETGLQFMELNTLYQLLAMKKKTPALLGAADCLLLMPDFVHFCLCGARAVEYTNGTTTQCLHALKREWASSLLRQFGLPRRIFPELVRPGAGLGRLRRSVAEASGLSGVRVVAPPSHDTASAVAGVPTSDTGKSSWAYISSGTWSLMGVETKQASLSSRTLALNFTNEGGLDGTFRLLKNIMGLWLVQRCKRSFDAKGLRLGYGQLMELARQAPALAAIVDPDDPCFLNPPDMPRAIQDYCRRTRQPAPRTEGALVRCALESLALKYSVVLHWLSELGGRPLDVIHVVGGGSQNALLNQMTADACQRPVICGPVEATAMGNLLTQVRASREIGSLAQMRAVVQHSSPLSSYAPGADTRWPEARERLLDLMHRPTRSR
jgi:rhamnulokinase